jgi:putative Holliday junction resolvase
MTPVAGPAAAASAAAAPVRCFLAFDFSTRRVGVAVGNSLLRRAQPLKTLAAEGEARFAAIEALLREWQPAALVVGVPFQPDGARTTTPGARAASAASCTAASACR